MKTQLMVLAGLGLPGALLGQQLIDAPEFFEPDFKVRRTGTNVGTLALTVTNTPVSSAPTTSGDVTWTHSAGGFAQVGTTLGIPAIPPLTPAVTLARVDAQLAAYTQTVNDTLVFGREISTDVELLGVVDLGSTVQNLTNQVAGASVLYNWESSATVSNLLIAPDQLMRVSFTVTSGSGLPVNLLSSADFGITTPGVTGASNESAELLDLLSILSIGSGSSTGNFSFDFRSSSAITELDFLFEASTGVGVSALGGTAGNQNVLTFSNFEVSAVPEPSVALLSTVCVGVLALRRRRR